MDYCETTQGTRVRVLLTHEELQFPAIDEVCNKFCEWLKVSREKTRSANRKSDLLYEQIMDFKVPAIKLKPDSAPPDSSMDTDSDSSSTRPITRSLRPRSRARSNQQQQPIPIPRPQTSPCTPTHQRIRAHMKQPPSSGSSVLGTALAQGHPKVSVTKIKQLLKSDSAMKRRGEEQERLERLIKERKVKEERAEAQKRQLLEERAENAKQNREKRLNHAAELRKAREEAKAQQKLREQEFKKVQVVEEKAPPPPVSQPMPPAPVPILNETFKKPPEDINNIDISIQDETVDGVQKEKIPHTAVWTRPPHLRTALISQFSKTDEERNRDVLEVFPSVQLPVELDKIFGSSKAVNTRYICRTSSAVWSPPNRAVKRSSSMVMTPNNK